MDSEILQATVDKQQFAVRVTADTSAWSRLLGRWVQPEVADSWRVAAWRGGAAGGLAMLAGQALC